MAWLVGPLARPLPIVARTLQLDGLCGHRRAVEITTMGEARTHSLCGHCGAEWWGRLLRGMRDG